MSKLCQSTVVGCQVRKTRGCLRAAARTAAASVMSGLDRYVKDALCDLIAADLAHRAGKDIERDRITADVAHWMAARLNTLAT